MAERWWVGHCQEIADYIALLCNNPHLDVTGAQVEQVLLAAEYVKPRVIQERQEERLRNFLQELENELGPVDQGLVTKMLQEMQKEK